VREQAAMEHAMVARSTRRDPLASVRLGLATGALSLVLLYGYASAVVGSVQTRRAGRGR
jgi:hypothetical protein